ncbi:MAG: hypothetical protein J6Z11_03780 [Candidatus Riflebacteria bacterium]|nr:hypothetical protein [Candidatus Riflebacteria bacterium]
MNKEMPFILAYYNKEITNKINNKYGIEPLEALRMFISSKTYKMLSDEKLEMWEFSPIGIFDMWESERITGDPRNSLYLRRD